MPPLLRALCRRLTRWGILPAAREPNSAIINIYEAVSWQGICRAAWVAAFGAWLLQPCRQCLLLQSGAASRIVNQSQ